MLDIETCKDQLLSLLYNEGIIDSTGNVIKSIKLSKSKYDEFVKLMMRTKSLFNKLQIDDCLSKLGVDIQDSPTTIQTPLNTTNLDIHKCIYLVKNYINLHSITKDMVTDNKILYNLMTHMYNNGFTDKKIIYECLKYSFDIK